MDALDRAVLAERDWIGESWDVAAVLDRMAEYRETARAAEQAGNDRARRRVGELLDLAEERVAELKAAKLRIHRGASVAAERGPEPRRASAPVVVTSADELRAAREEIAAIKAAHRAAVLARDEAERRERQAALAREQQRAEERERREEEERVRAADKARRAEEEREREAERERAVARRVEAAAAAARQEAAQAAARQAATAVVAPAPVQAAPPPHAVATMPASIAPEVRQSGAGSPAPAALASAPPKVHSARDASPTMCEEPPAYTGADVAAGRRSTGLSQTAFARLLGVTQGAISKAECNPRGPVGPSLRLAMSKRNGGASE